jgi:ABC-type transport system substrate-binding protein
MRRLKSIHVKVSRLLVVLLSAGLLVTACGPADVWQPDANDPPTPPATTEPARPADTPVTSPGTTPPETTEPGTGTGADEGEGDAEQSDH